MSLFDERGAELWENLLERDFRKGARQVLLLGVKGSGKSTLLAQLAYAGLHNKDIVVWRGRSRDFWPHFPEDLVKVYVHELDEFHVWEVPFGSNKKTEVTDRYDVIRYDDLNKLLERLEPGKISVIYEPTWARLSQELLTMAGLEDGHLYPGTWAWYDVFFHLSKRIDMRWITMIFDEFDDIAPSGASGPQWRLIEAIQHSLAEFREKYVTLFASTHDPNHIDPRILKKFSGFIYLKGAFVPKFSMMKKRAVTMNLSLGNGIIELIGEGYGGFTFSDVPRRPYGYAIEKIWRGPQPEPTWVRRGRRGILQELLSLAREEGPDIALERLEELRHDGEVSESYYYLIKKKIRELVASGV